jgi:hypothetical protein
MNRLFDRQNGFQLGYDVDGTTRGMWLWARRLPDSGKLMVAIDTEGLDDSLTGDCSEIGMDVFLLSVLCSSLCIFNTRGHISDRDLDLLSYIIKMAQRITVHTPSQPTTASSASPSVSASVSASASARASVLRAGDVAPTVASVMPSLLWLVRDFVLDVESADAYLAKVSHIASIFVSLLFMSVS